MLCNIFITKKNKSVSLHFYAYLSLFFYNIFVSLDIFLLMVDIVLVFISIIWLYLIFLCSINFSILYSTLCFRSPFLQVEYVPKSQIFSAEPWFSAISKTNELNSPYFNLMDQTSLKKRPYVSSHFIPKLRNQTRAFLPPFR